MKTIKKVLTIVSCTFLLFSCNDEFENGISPDANVKTLNELKFTPNDKLRKKFGTALVSAMAENESLRAFLKTEALKKFNKDYDVLYHLVKDKPLIESDNTRFTSNYATFRSLLLPYFENEAELIAIENQLPLLTIFVPKLPENSFSAQNWITTNTKPAVAIRMDDENDVPIIFNKDDTYILDAGSIPDFPVVVIKDNERVLSNTMSGYDDLDATILNAGSGLYYQYIDINLDPILSPDDPNFGNSSLPINNSTVNTPTFDWLFVPGRDATVSQFMIDAYNVFNGTVTNPWQRDNIYYGLTTTTQTGNLKNTYKESITYIKFEGTASNVYNTISQRSPGNPDPALAAYEAGRNPGPAWTDGNFEFVVWFTHGSKTDANGTNARRVFTASPGDVFNITYHRERINWWSSNVMGIYRWFPIITSNKPMDFVNGFNGQKLILRNWDLEELANRFNYRFEEADIAVTNELTQSQSTKHNQNVNFDATTGDKVKVGIKYGASTEWTESTSRKFSWTTSGANFLGEQTVHFMDNVVNKHPVTNKYYPAIHSTGIVTFESRPVQVNF